VISNLYIGPYTHGVFLAGTLLAIVPPASSFFRTGAIEG
jgi:hypothetical protein